MERLHHDYLDARPRALRRNESRDDQSYLKAKDAGYASRMPSSTARDKSSGINKSSGMSSERSSRQNNDRYDPRYHYPPSSPTSDRRTYLPRSPLRKRKSWPPQPFAEDEVVSLRRESNAQQLLQEVKKDEAPSRGSVDQEPLIQDVPELTNQHERQFVFNESGRQDSRMGIPTPPTSDDERTRRARRRPSKLNVNTDARVPELDKRTSSPYAFTKITSLSTENSTSSLFASQDTLTPPASAAAVRTSARSASSPKPPSSPRRDSARFSPVAKKGKDYFSAAYNNTELAVDDAEYDSSGRKAIPRGKQVTEKSRSENARTSVHDFASQFPSAVPIRKTNLDARRNTDSQGSLPTLGRLSIDRSRRPTPLMASTSLSEAQDADPIATASLDPRSADLRPRSREASYTSSRGPSPANSVGHGTASTSHSPRLSADYSREDSLGGSRNGSAPDSRPSSPSPRTPAESPRLARTDLDWSALLAANAARRSKTASRLVETVSRKPSAESSRRTTPQESYSNRMSSLPYPEDFPGSVAMPEEHEHAYLPPGHPPRRPVNDCKSNVQTDSPALSHSATTSPQSAFRPDIMRGYSANTPSVPELRSAKESRPRLAEVTRTNSFAVSSEAKKELQALMKKGLPPCSRPDPVAGYDDWYTVIGSSNIDFCPDCIDTLFERTVFRPQFRRSLPRNFNEKVRCAFGSPWIRLAWLLTLQQQRTDLALLKDVSEIEDTTEPCPGNIESARSWYGLRDPDGLFVRDFHVCFGDVRKVERLLPTVAGLFVKLPHRASYDKRICAIRTDSNRFSAYLDALVSTHEKALSSRKGADPMALIDLVERKTRLRECTRDNMLIGGLWHFAPDLPSLTICEDCFELIVEPEIKKGSSVAKKFNRTVQPVYGEGIGSSCQLYSRRMRRAFIRAVEDNDFKYLARKSKERREAELYLQDKYKDVMRRAKRLSLEGDVSEEDERRLNRDLEKITTEWKERWE